MTTPQEPPSSKSSDPLYVSLPHVSSKSPITPATTLSILRNAFPDPSSVYAEKVKDKPLPLRPTVVPSTSSAPANARDRRRLHREVKLKRRRTTKHVSAKEKREMKIYDIPKEEAKFENFRLLNNLWNSYVTNLLPPPPSTINTATMGQTLLKADYHGALVLIEKCKCYSRVGITGICVKETKGLFEIVTMDDRLLKIPKEKTVFVFTAETGDARGQIKWRLWGNQFITRAGDRAGKKWKGKIIEEL